MDRTRQHKVLKSQLAANPQCYADMLDTMREIGAGMEGVAFLLPNGQILKAMRLTPANKDTFPRDVMVMRAAAQLKVAPEVYDAWTCGEMGFVLMQNAHDDGYEQGKSLENQPLPTVSKVYIQILRGVLKVAVTTGYTFADIHTGNFFWNPQTLKVRIIDWGLLSPGTNISNALITMNHCYSHSFPRYIGRNGDVPLGTAYSLSNYAMTHYNAVVQDIYQKRPEIPAPIPQENNKRTKLVQIAIQPQIPVVPPNNPPLVQGLTRKRLASAEKVVMVRAREASIPKERASVGKRVRQKSVSMAMEVDVTPLEQANEKIQQLTDELKLVKDQLAECKRFAALKAARPAAAAARRGHYFK